MGRAEMNRPFPVLVAPHGRKATVEAVLTVEPDTALPAGDLEEVLVEVAGRVGRALDGIFGSLPAEVKLDDVSVVNPPHVPFFPATFGDRVYADPVDVYEGIEALRKGTPLEGVLYDCAGRAFSVRVWASFRREKEEDRSVPDVWTLHREEEAG